MSWTIGFSRKAAKQAQKLQPKHRSLLEALVKNMEVSGPVMGEWPNYSKLSDGSHHCHLDYRTVACWAEENKKLKILEVYYVGSRKDAPY